MPPKGKPMPLGRKKLRKRDKRRRRSKDPAVEAQKELRQELQDLRYLALESIQRNGVSGDAAGDRKDPL